MIRLAKIFVLVLILCLLLTVNTAFAEKQLICGGTFIAPGMHYTKVLRLCGEPVSKEVVGYTASIDGSPLLKIEEWVYGSEGGYYFYLRFIANRLRSIRSERN